MNISVHSQNGAYNKIITFSSKYLKYKTQRFNLFDKVHSIKDKSEELLEMVVQTQLLKLNVFSYQITRN